MDLEELKAHLGYGQIGIVPLPTKFDEYEHNVINFKGPGARQRVTNVSLLMFGGISYDSKDISRKTFLLDIDIERNSFTMIYLPKTHLPKANTFIDSQPLHVNTHVNVLTLIGKYQALRINIAQALDKLVWTPYRANIGYHEQIDFDQAPAHYLSMCQELSSPTKSQK